MNHIDEHTLELYVLGSAKVAARTQEIEGHLALCVGCRETVERMKAFYGIVTSDIAKQPEPPEFQSQALVEIERRMTKAYEPDVPAIPLRPVTRVQRFQHFVRRHPVVSGSATFAVLAGLALLFSTTSTLFKVHKNPVSINYNVSLDRIEARTKLSALLESGLPNVYTIEKAGVRKLIYQSPWYKDGKYAGIVELSLPIPEQMPHFVRDSQAG